MLPYPQAIVYFALYVLHFFLARWITIKLIENDYLKRNSPEFKKAVLFWFVPVMGALGLWFLFLVNKFIIWWRWFSKWIKLSHYHVQPVGLTPQQQFAYDEEEILKRVELIKEKERLEILAAQAKKQTKRKRK
jgi:hypothetical protein